jgi:hypothetical protein
MVTAMGLPTSFPTLRVQIVLLATTLLSAPAPALLGGAQAAPAETRKADVVVLSARDLNLLNRLTWGVNPSIAQEYASLGADKFLDRQLHPPPVSKLPPDAQAAIDALGISHSLLVTFVADVDQQSKAANAITDPPQRQAAQTAVQEALNKAGREAAIRSLLRDLYSPDQLREQMTCSGSTISTCISTNRTSAS